MKTLSFLVSMIFSLSAYAFPTETTISESNYSINRAVLISEVFGCGGIPATSAQLAYSSGWVGEAYDYLSSGAKLFDRNSTKLVIFHAGHNQEATNIDSGAGLILYAIASGYDVMTINMPAGDHAQYSSLDYPMTAFLTPIAESLNYALSINNYDEIIMSGLSGGGWSTVMYAALDERISKSYPVAGSWPKYLRYDDGGASTIGDYEQLLPGISASYLDLYALATSSGREQHQYFNSNDPCCFSGYRSLEYVNTVDSALTGDFSVTVLTSSVHEVSQGIYNVIAPDLAVIPDPEPEVDPELPPTTQHFVWPLDDFSSVLSSVSGSVDGTYYGVPTFSGSSVTMTGQYASIPHSDLLNIGEGEYTIKMTASFAGASYGMAFGKFDTAFPYLGPIVFFNYPSAGRIQFREMSGVGYTVNSSTTGLNNSSVHDYEFRRVNESGVWFLEIYIDGNLDSSAQLSSVQNLNNLLPLHLMSRPAGNQYVYGEFHNIELLIH